jgi:hypothetical protein
VRVRRRADKPAPVAVDLQPKAAPDAATFHRFRPADFRISSISAMGHEQELLLPRSSGCFRFSQRTFDEGAPKVSTARERT